MSDTNSNTSARIEKIEREFNDYSFRLSKLDITQRQRVQDLIKATQESIEQAKNSQSPELADSASTNVEYMKELARSELKRSYAVTKAESNQYVANARLKQIGTDELTSLPNRAAFNQQLHTAVEKSGQRATHDRFGNKHPDNVNKIHVFALVAVDVDNFKGVNDDYGHQTGDEILKVIAQNLQETTREDTNATLNGFGRLSVLRDDETTSRPGGDEFTIMLNTQVDLNVDENASPAEKRSAYRAAIKQAESDFDKALNRIREANKGRYAEYEGNVFPISLSMGMHRIRNNDTVQSAYHKADLASLKDKETKVERWQENVELIRQQGLTPVTVEDKRGDEKLRKKIDQISQNLVALQNAGIEMKISLPARTKEFDAVKALQDAGMTIEFEEDDTPDLDQSPEIT